VISFCGNLKTTQFFEQISEKKAPARLLSKQRKKLNQPKVTTHPMKAHTKPNQNSPEAISAFLAQTVAQATAAAEACVALHRASTPRPADESPLSAEDWLALDTALDHRLANRARANHSSRKAA
jgi:hypothetical protein